MTNTSDAVVVALGGIVDDVKSPAASESWTISLRAVDRFFTMRFNGAVVRNMTVKALRHNFLFVSPSSNAFYERGVIQMMNAASDKSTFGSTDPLIRYYATGKGAVDMQRTTAVAPQSQTVVLSGQGSYGAGLQEVMAGSFAPLDKWVQGSCKTHMINWSKHVKISPIGGNCRQAPRFRLPPVGTSPGRSLRMTLISPH